MKVDDTFGHAQYLKFWCDVERCASFAAKARKLIK